MDDKKLKKKDDRKQKGVKLDKLNKQVKKICDSQRKKKGEKPKKTC